MLLYVESDVGMQHTEVALTILRLYVLADQRWPHGGGDSPLLDKRSTSEFDNLPCQVGIP